MAKLTPTSKYDIIKRFEEGVKISEIAKCYGVDQAAIRYVIKNYQQFGESSLAEKRVGRKKLANLTPEQRENYRLNKLVADLKLENKILKQIQAFFKTKTPK